jgi:precorrin-2 dehydrogenase/sirohydrochlorin ferrochelatase
MDKSYYPIFVDLSGRTVAVVGGGEVALRKAEGLAAAGARVRVVAPDICDALAAVAGAELRREPYSASALDGAALAVAATDDPQVNSRVAADARARGILCNVVDRPAECDFIVPSVLRRGPLVIAVSTGGASPSAAADICRSLGRQFGPAYGRWLEALARARRDVLDRVADEPKRREIFARLSEADVLAAAEAGTEALHERVAEVLKAFGLADS